MVVLVNTAINVGCVCDDSSSRLYLPLRYDEANKKFLHSYMKKYNLEMKITLIKNVYVNKNLDNIDEIYK